MKMSCHSPSEVPHDLKEDTTSTPHVHLKAVVPISEEALWGSVPACGDVFCVRGLGVHTPTRTKVAKLQTTLLQYNLKKNVYDLGPHYHCCISVEQIRKMTHLTLMRMFSGFTSLWKIPQLYKKKKKLGGNNVNIHHFVFILPFCVNWNAFITTCACVEVTCRAGTCSSLLYGQAGAFFVLEGMKNWCQPQIHPKV